MASLTRQITSCLDASSSVAAPPRRQIAVLVVGHIHQVLEGGHLLLQRGGDPRKEGAAFDGLGVEEADKHKHICSVIRLDSCETSEITGPVLWSGGAVYHKLPAHTRPGCRGLLGSGRQDARFGLLLILLCCQVSIE